MALKRKKGTLNAANLISNLLIQKITKLFFLKMYLGYLIWKKDFRRNVVLRSSYVDLMVIPLSCSSLRVSIAHLSPACSAEMTPALDKRESVRVVLPWSTWAMTEMFRICLGRDITPRTCSSVYFTCKTTFTVNLSQLHELYA